MFEGIVPPLSDAEEIQSTAKNLVQSIRQLEQVDSTSSNPLANRENPILNIHIRGVAFHIAIRKTARYLWLAIISDIAEESRYGL